MTERESERKREIEREGMCEVCVSYVILDSQLLILQVYIIKI